MSVFLLLQYIGVKGGGGYQWVFFTRYFEGDAS